MMTATQLDRAAAIAEVDADVPPPTEDSVLQEPAGPGPAPSDQEPEMTEISTHLDRDAIIKTIRKALRERSGKSWSVRGERGTAWGWITISSPPARSADQWGTMTEAEAAELGELLGFDRPVHRQGQRIPDGHDYYREFVDRAAGRTPSVHGTPYWD